jgi:hypothetical protein
MKRPSKKEIREAVEKLRQHKEGPDGATPSAVPKTSEKKANKNRIRKKGV